MSQEKSELTTPETNIQEATLPPNYQCSKCGASDCRLWLDSRAPLTANTPLFCRDCAEDAQKRVHPPGWKSARRKKGEETIGVHAPAIPLSGGGYKDPHHISRAERDWWLRLNKGAPDVFAELDRRTRIYE